MSKSAETSPASDDSARDDAPPVVNIGELLVQLEAAQADATKQKELYLRTLADLDNYRRRAAREKDEVRRFAAGALMEDLVPALDNLRLGLQSAIQAHPEAKAVIDGIKLVADQLRAVLIQHGLKEIDPAGQPFDPKLHESIAAHPSADIPEGHVLQVVRPGYVLNDRLLRAASVVVSSGKR